MTNKALTLMRLNKEQKQLQNQPIIGVITKRQQTYHFHFCLYQLDGDYKGGFYHGVLQLPQTYPFAAPKLLFFTRNGRFQINMPICTTFTNYHQQSWTSAWNVRTMIIATISFMQGTQYGYGCIQTGSVQRKNFAQQSLNKNLRNPVFKRLFGQKLVQIGKITMQEFQNRVNYSQGVEPSMQQSLTQPQQQQQNRRNANRRRSLYILYGIIAVIIICTLIQVI